MKFLPIAFVSVVVLLAGCGPDRATHDDIQAPPATKTTSGATEDIIAQRAAAVSRGQVDAANLRAAEADKRAADAQRAAARSAGDVALADAAVKKAGDDLKAAQEAAAKDHGDAVAAKGALQDQRHAEIIGSLDRFYFVAALLLLLAGFLAYEGNLVAAGRVALSAAGLIVTAMAVSFAVSHEGIILAVSVVGLVAELVWHYRTRLLSAEQALVHAVRGYPWADAEKHVQAALLAAWTRSLSAFERLEVLLHLRAKPVPPPTTTTNPPASP